MGFKAKKCRALRSIFLGQKRRYMDINFSKRKGTRTL